MTSSVFVGATPVQIYVPGVVGTPNVTLTNAGTSILYLGQADVSDTTGLPFLPGTSLGFPNAPYPFFAVAGSSAGTPATTLADDATAGDSTVTVTSATGLHVGQNVLIGSDAEQEAHTITNVASTTITITPELEFDQASGAAFAVVATTGQQGGTIRVTAGV